MFDDEQIILTGVVPSQDAATRLVDVAGDHRLGSAPIVDNLMITPGVPAPGGVRIVEYDSLRVNEGFNVVQPDYARQLDRIVDLMNRFPSTSMYVVGNTDQRGDPERNFTVSGQRAQAVAEYLVSQGIDRSRLTVEAAGESNPLSLEENEEAYSLNRRTDFVIFGLLED